MLKLVIYLSIFGLTWSFPKTNLAEFKYSSAQKSHFSSAAQVLLVASIEDVTFAVQPCSGSFSAKFFGQMCHLEDNGVVIYDNHPPPSLGDGSSVATSPVGLNPDLQLDLVKVPMCVAGGE